MMNEKIAVRVSRIVSGILHPALAPFYAALVLFFGHTVLRNMPVGIKFYYLAIVGMTTAIIPLLAIGLLRNLYREHYTGAPGRWERVLPLALMLACYIACLYMLSNSALVFLLRRYLWAVAVCLALTAVAAWFRNVSAEMVVAGSVVALLALIDFARFGQVVPAFCAAVLLSGALASARLQLGRHNPAQIASGFLAGLLTTICMMLI